MRTDEHNNKGYEVSDITAKPVVWSIGIMAFVIVASVVGMIAYVKTLDALPKISEVERSPMAEVRPSPPGPHLQADPPVEWKAYKDSQDKQLDSYGWVNQEARIAHIPIDVAMKRVLKQGFPTR